MRMLLWHGRRLAPGLGAMFDRLRAKLRSTVQLFWLGPEMAELRRLQQEHEKELAHKEAELRRRGYGIDEFEQKLIKSRRSRSLDQYKLELLSRLRSTRLFFRRFFGMIDEKTYYLEIMRKELARLGYGVDEIEQMLITSRRWRTPDKHESKPLSKGFIMLNLFSLVLFFGLFILPYAIPHDALDRHAYLREPVQLVVNYVPYIGDLAGISPYPHQLKISLSLGILFAPVWAMLLVLSYKLEGLLKPKSTITGVQLFVLLIFPFLLAGLLWSLPTFEPVSENPANWRIRGDPRIWAQSRLGIGMMFMMFSSVLAGIILFFIGGLLVILRLLSGKLKIDSWATEYKPFDTHNR